MNKAETLRVPLGTRSYDIVVGAGLLAQAGQLVAQVAPQKRAIVVSDDTVAPLYLERLSDALEGAGIACQSLVLPAGEATKSFSHLEALLSGLLDLGIERRTSLIALGGGVIGDLVGLAAGLVLRGVPYIQVPTTLLSQVDSSVGGKTGLNTRHGKNLVGLFYQPRLVLADTETLDTLPPRQLRAGYAEVVKYGVIDRPDFFHWLEHHGQALLDGDHGARRQAIVSCCQAKADIVAADERESGRRALLNLGHTFGHALEAEAGYGDTLLHGEAVALGMVMALATSVRLGLCPSDQAERLCRHLRATGLPTDLASLDTKEWTAEALYAHMKQDKKVADGAITFVLCRAIGEAFLSNQVSAADVKAVLEEALVGE